MSATRYREIDVAGPPAELGEQIGEAAREEVRGFCEIALSRVQKTVAVSRDAAESVAARSLKFAEDYSPDLVDELRGTARAAGVSLSDLMLLQVRNQLSPDADAGCTSVATCASDVHPSLVAQNWDNDPALDPFTVVLRRRPKGKPANMTLTQAGLIAYVGLSENGIGACLNTLPAPSRPVGVPHYFTLRRIYESDSMEGAVAVVASADRTVPANIILATADGPADLEVTIDDIHVLTGDDWCEPGWLVHTNHCRHPDLTPINDDFPELIQSHPRLQRTQDRMRETSPPTIASIQAALSDHEGFPRSVCRHANDDPETGFWETVFSVIVDPANGQLHATRGTPCDRPYETYSLN